MVEKNEEGVERTNVNSLLAKRAGACLKISLTLVVSKFTESEKKKIAMSRG